MAWLLLVLAGLLEIAWVIGLKFTDGFTRPLPTALTLVSMIASMALKDSYWSFRTGPPAALNSALR